MNNQIYNLISDATLSDELSFCLRNRTLEQKFLYLQKGATNYYDVVNTDAVYYSAYPYELFVDFGTKYIFSKSKKMAIISLGCWNSDIESYIFEHMKYRYHIDYYGVDSSKNMLDLSIQRMKDLSTVWKNFICADFSTNEFRRELSQLTLNNDIKIFTFFSNTFGNINPNNIIDILYNLLKPGEKIWLDVRLRSGKTTKDNLKDFEKYYSYLSNKEMTNLFLNPIESMNIDKESWEFALKTINIDPLEAINYQYSFVFNKKVSVTIKNETTTILPGEELQIVSIYTYDPDGLVNFFEGHNFKLIQKLIKDSRGQFLFEKR